MKVFVFILVCALIACFITPTSAGRQKNCKGQGGVELGQRCNGIYAESECLSHCQNFRNSEKGKCVNKGCCCFGETDGFPHGAKRWGNRQ